MSRSTKATLLSTLVFPGAGHFYLKKHRVGTTLASVSVAALGFLIVQAVDRAQHIAEQIQSGQVASDIATIVELVSTQTLGPEAQVVTIATAVLTASWLIGIVDSYRIGRAQERNAELSS